MKLYGDVAEHEKELAIALEKQERVFDLSFNIPKEELARGYVCLAHDWYHIGDEDEGLRLLQKAENTSPGYFKVAMAKHCYENIDYEYLVRKLTAEIIYMLLSKLEDRRT